MQISIGTRVTSDHAPSRYTTENARYTTEYDEWMKTERWKVWRAMHDPDDVRALCRKIVRSRHTHAQVTFIITWALRGMLLVASYLLLSKAAGR